LNYLGIVPQKLIWTEFIIVQLDHSFSKNLSLNVFHWEPLEFVWKILFCVVQMIV